LLQITANNLAVVAQQQPLYQEYPMTKIFARFVNDESGATAIEYGLIAALVSVVIIGALTTLGTKLTSTFTSVSSSLK
jgi:pilus assembly protein Flp/PilA